MFPGAPEPFADLSTGINPHAYPLPVLAAEVFARLPDPADLARLKAAAAAAYGAASSDGLVAGPGTQMLLPLVANLVPPSRATVLAPTYGEFARAAALAGHRVHEVADVTAMADADLAIVANPNNPDGRVVDRNALRGLGEALRRRSGLLVIDEAFMDVGPAGASLAGDASRNVVVLRSFGKFHGLAGVRLGFALAESAIAARLSASLGPWAVSGPAIAAGIAALRDRAWADATRTQLAAAAQRLDAMLQGAGLSVVGGTSLFRLVETEVAAGLFHHLGRAGILVRRFEQHPAWLRFGLPADEPQWQRLVAALAEYVR